MKQIIERKETQRTLNDEGNVNVVTVTTLPRFVGQKVCYDGACQQLMEMIQSQCDIWCARNREGFENMNTLNDWEPDGESLKEDLESFQRYLDEKYEKNTVIAYALGAYVHSGVSFSISKSEDNRCRWDSGTIGFIGIPNNMLDYIRELTEDLDSAWNGGVVSYEIYDNLRDEISEQAYSYDRDAVKRIVDIAKNQFDIDFDKIDVEY